MNIKISVIFTVFNVEDYLYESLTSLLNQTIIDDIEVIMVDDGSTDNSGIIIEKFAFLYDNFHAYHKENAGPSSSRNYGMKYAKGEYVHFFDSDDIIPNDAYEKMYNFAKIEEYDIIVGDFVRFTSNKAFTNTIRNHVFGNLSDKIENTNLVNFPKLSWDMFVWNKLIKREFLERNNIEFYHENVSFEDNLYSIELYDKAEKIGILPEFIYYWRIRESNDSLTQQYDIKRVNDLIKIFNLVNGYLVNNIHDTNILEEKYLKWLTFDIPMYVDMIKNYPNECHDWMLDSIYSVVHLIPDQYFDILNSHYKVLYDIINNKDLSNLLIFTDYNFKRNPVIPSQLDDKYKNKLDFENDAFHEELDTYAASVNFDKWNIIINFKNFIPYHLSNGDERISFRLINDNFEDVLLEGYYSNGKLILPINLINLGENLLLTKFTVNNLSKENFVKTNTKKTVSYENFDIDISRGKTGYLRIIKHERNDDEFIIEDIIFDNEKFKFKGYSNNLINNIFIRDYLNFNQFECPISYNNNSFEFNIYYNDLLKAPIKKWEILFDEEFKKINLLKDFNFTTENYLITAKNYGNKIVLEMVLYNSIDYINFLSNEINRLNRNNKKLKKKNKKLLKKNKNLQKINKSNSENLSIHRKFKRLFKRF